MDNELVLEAKNIIKDYRIITTKYSYQKDIAASGSYLYFLESRFIIHNNIYREGVKKINHQTVVILATKNVNSNFIKQYHNTLFLVAKENLDYWKGYINADCSIFDYNMPSQILKKRDDGILVYIIGCCFQLEPKPKTINVFVNAYQYYMSLKEIIIEKGINVKFNQLDENTNLIINTIKDNRRSFTNIKEVSEIISNICPSVKKTIAIDTLFNCGFCKLTKEGNIVVLKELL